MDLCFSNNPCMDIAKLISDNLTAWMAATPSLDTFKKVAAKSGVGFGTVQRAKNGDGNITVERLTAIAAAFGRQPAELITSPSDAIRAASDAEAYPLTPLPHKSAREERIAAIHTLLARTDDYGLVAILEKAKDVARDYPLDDAGGTKG